MGFYNKKKYKNKTFHFFIIQIALKQQKIEIKKNCQKKQKNFFLIASNFHQLVAFVAMFQPNFLYCIGFGIE